MKKNSTNPITLSAINKKMANDLQDRLCSEVTANETYKSIHKILKISGEIERAENKLASNPVVDADYREAVYELADEAIMYMMSKEEEYLKRAKKSDVALYKRPEAKRTKAENEQIKKQNDGYYFVKIGDKYGCVLKKFRNLVIDYYRRQSAQCRGGASEVEREMGIYNSHISFEQKFQGETEEGQHSFGRQEDYITNEYLKSGEMENQHERVEERDLLASFYEKFASNDSRFPQELKIKMAHLKAEGHTRSEIMEKLNIKSSELKALQQEFQDALDSFKDEFNNGSGEGAA